MSIFQKITNLLFEENDVDVIAEDELEDISLQEEEKQKEKQNCNWISAILTMPMCILCVKPLKKLVRDMS